MGQGYLRYPTISGDTIVFVCEDDLWRVDADGGRAWRLTAGVAEAGVPRLSPDGTRVAFVGTDEGATEIYVLALEGGEARRLTYDGARCAPLGWWDDDTVLYASDAGRPFPGDQLLYRVGAEGGVAEVLPVGPAQTLAFPRTPAVQHPSDGPDPSDGPNPPSSSHAPDGAALGRPSVVGRETRDPARWKRYRGGTAGRFWVDPTGEGRFVPLLKDLGGNLADPCWIGDRIFFLSDHEGIGNVYSVRPDGSDLRRHTDHGDYYARHLSGDGARLVYHCGADVYLLDPAADGPRRLDIRVASSRTQRTRRFVDAAKYLQSAELSPDGARLAITTRGKAFSFGTWEGPVVQHGDPEGTRYRLLTWVPGGEYLVAVAAGDGPEETLVRFAADGSQRQDVDEVVLDGVEELAVSPASTAERITVAAADHRNRLLVVRLPGPGSGESATVTVHDTSPIAPIGDLAFSPDGRWLAYRFPEAAGDPDHVQPSSLRLLDLESGRTTTVVERVLHDHQPAFDPSGNYLYFLGTREFSPVYDPVHFDLSFPNPTRPYAVALRADLPSPFVREPAPPGAESGDGSSAKGDSGADGKENGDRRADPVQVDLDGLSRRVVPFPVPASGYQRLLAIPGKVLLLSSPAGDLPPSIRPVGEDGVLECFDLATGKTEKIAEKVREVRLSADASTLLYRSGDRLRVLRAGRPAPEGDEPGRESGWVDLSRVKVSVRPAFEWPQMFREAWNAQRRHFWTEDMSGVDWDAVYERYAPLVARVASRSELSDLLWEMQGELGTSHAYERGGDLRTGPQYRQGYLGADYTWDAATRTYRVARLVEGDPADPAASSPLERPGVDVRPGDAILAINGLPVGADASPAQRLVDLGGQEVAVTVRRGDGEPRTVRITALDDERPARYREWVEANRRYVHERSEGRLGYLHIPDMMPKGYAEFLRGYLLEHDRDGLIVDVRNNSGGHVSGLILEKLSRRRLGASYTRWGRPQSYPVEAPRGPMVALTNARAGSDGDIFCQSFKLLGLGPLIGQRTWGGVVGLIRLQVLADGSTTTQPGLAFSFDEVSWGVENHGVDPDIEVDPAPQDYADGEDTQLATAIEVGLAELERRPPYRHVPAERPRLALPVLPPREA